MIVEYYHTSDLAENIWESELTYNAMSLARETKYESQFHPHQSTSTADAINDTALRYSWTQYLYVTE